MQTITLSFAHISYKDSSVPERQRHLDEADPKDEIQETARAGS